MGKLSLLTGAGLGIGLMYLMDAEKGSERQEALRENVMRLWSQARTGAVKVKRDLEERQEKAAQEMWDEEATPANGETKRPRIGLQGM